MSSNKIIVLYGSRQVGKTTLAKEILKKIPLKTLSINADRREFTDTLSSRDLGKLKRLVSGYELVFIDEAQRISDIGINLKILHDEIPDLKIIATGSSSFDLANTIKEPLTGRTWTYILYPVSLLEFRSMYNHFELDIRLEEFLIFGMYPEVFSFKTKGDKIFFWDLGIRNAVIENFNELSLRTDIGQLWENFLIIERIKSMAYQQQFANRYFWRTYTGAELDYVVDRGGKLFGFEFKWGNKTAKPPKTWLSTYSEANFKLINRDNYLEFVFNTKN